MEQPDTTAGVLSAHRTASTDEDTVTKTDGTDCHRCSKTALTGYAVCNNCLDSLPEDLCTARVLAVLLE